MFGIGEHDSKLKQGKLPVYVHATASREAYALANKVWKLNAHSLRRDPANGKELVPFTFTKPKCVVWMQRDAGRTDTFEIIIVWLDKDETTEVHVVSESLGEPLGDDSRTIDILNTILTTPAVVPAQEEPA